MENLFCLKTASCELLSYVASNLVKEFVEFSFEEFEVGLFVIVSGDNYTLDYFADAFVCNCDASSEYQVIRYNKIN